MWNVAQGRNVRILITFLVPFLFSDCLSSASVSGSATGSYHLAFLSPFNQPSYFLTQNSLQNFQVAVENAGGQTVTSVSPVTITLTTYLDASCTVPITANP